MFEIFLDKNQHHAKFILVKCLITRNSDRQLAIITTKCCEMHFSTYLKKAAKPG
jgi:hypothetical protein